MSYRSIFQVWLIIAVSGAIGLTAMGWNDNEKGSPLAALHEVFDLLKTRVQQQGKQ